MHNIPHTKEAIEKIKIARAKQIITDDHKEKIRQSLMGRIPWNKGKKMPDDWIRKRKEITKKSWENLEIRNRRIAGMKGRELSKNTKIKISKKNKIAWKKNLK